MTGDWCGVQLSEHVKYEIEPMINIYMLCSVKSNMNLEHFEHSLSASQLDGASISGAKVFIIIIIITVIITITIIITVIFIIIIIITAIIIITVIICAVCVERVGFSVEYAFYIQLVPNTKNWEEFWCMMITGMGNNIWSWSALIANVTQVLQVGLILILVRPLL